jgi:hypothetical protein
LSKAVQQFNAKRTREIKKNPALEHVLPKKLNVKELTQSIETRNDFKNQLKSIQKFKEKDATKIEEYENGLTLTKWERQKVQHEVNVINQRREQERKKAEQYEATSRGKPIGLKRGEMGSARMNEFNPKKFNPNKIRAGKEWEMFKESAAKQFKENYTNEKLEAFKQNYIKALGNIFGSRVDNVINTIKNMDSDRWYKVTLTEQEASIDYIYDPHEAEEKIDTLTSIWDDAEEGYYD